MKTELFTKKLIEVAFSAMVCDSHIDKLELTKLKEITSKDFYFQDINIDKEVDLLTKEFFLKGSLMIDHVMNDLLNLKIENYQKMILVEIAIGVINADRSIEQEEIDFVNRLIINLKIPSELINSRFGDWKSIDGNINSN